MVQVLYRVQNDEPKVREVGDDVYAKRSELWTARLNRTKYRERADGFYVLRDVQGNETLVDPRGRTESEAEEEARLKGVDSVPFPRDDNDRRGTWSFWPRPWRELAEGPALGPRTDEADEAGLDGLRAGAPRPRSWWGWFSTRRRTMPTPPSHEPVLPQVSAQKPPQAERDLITFASDEEDDGYASAVEEQAN